MAALRPRHGEEVVLCRRERTYWCRREGPELVIRNAAGQERRQDNLVLEPLAPVEPEHLYLRGLFQEAAMALGLTG